VDAVRNLAREKGLNPDNWRDIEQVLRQSSNKSFMQGHSRIKAKTALKYVYEVWIRYTHYKNIVSEE
jgi:membrane-bound lytic murein transglycosylase MltF